MQERGGDAKQSAVTAAGSVTSVWLVLALTRGPRWIYQTRQNQDVIAKQNAAQMQLISISLFWYSLEAKIDNTIWFIQQPFSFSYFSPLLSPD